MESNYPLGDMEDMDFTYTKTLITNVVNLTTYNILKMFELYIKG